MLRRHGRKRLCEKDRTYDLVCRALVKVQHHSQRTCIYRDAYVDRDYVSSVRSAESFLHARELTAWNNDMEIQALDRNVKMKKKKKINLH